jgi:hypothetical protein
MNGEQIRICNNAKQEIQIKKHVLILTVVALSIVQKGSTAHFAKKSQNENFLRAISVL